MRAIYLFMCGIAIAGCTRGGNSDLTAGDEPALIRLHADLLILDQRAALMHKDSSYVSRERDSLYQSAGISRGAYERAIEKYKLEPESWKAFNIKVIARLEQLQRARALPKDTVKSPEKI
jgi:hypothetical protein